MPTEADNTEERLARIERLVSELAAVEAKAEQLATEVREKATRIAAELNALKNTHSGRN